MRVRILAHHRAGRSPAQRYRFEQVMPWLAAHGVECELSPIIDAATDRILYRRGHLLRKARAVWRGWWQRRRDTSRRRLAGVDVVLVQRDAFFFGGPIFERRIVRAGVPLVFDFDDAIWLDAVNPASRMVAWLRPADRVARIMKLATIVIAGNAHLADWAREHGARRVEIIPSTIDTDAYRLPDTTRPPRPVCIGWTGSFSTIAHLRLALPALRRVRERLGDAVTFRAIGDASFVDESLGLRGQPWVEATEVADLAEVDIGIMPLPDDDWSRGKCGLKALQYMALAIPAVISPVGVNREIVSDGVSGFLPRSEDEWVARLCELAGDAALRARLGEAGRRTVEERYSTRSQRDRWRAVFEEAAGTRAT